MMKIADIKRWAVPLLFITWALPALSCSKTDCVRIGTWNIAWLGSEKREQYSDATTISAMADLIADKWSIDLISLQEINTGMDGQIRGEKFTTLQWRMLKSSLQKKGYTTQSGNSGQAQHLVFAWRKPVQIIQPAQDMEIPESYLINDYCRSSGLRKPLVGLFKAGNFDFWAIGVHLKSGYGGNTACTNDVRSLQVYYISKQIEKLQKQDPDILLMGDFNASSNHKSLAVLQDKGFIALTDKKFRNSASNNRTQGSGKRGSVIDLMMVRPEKSTEWINGSTFLYKPENPDEFSRKFSDHVPVWADFTISKDND